MNVHKLKEDGFSLVEVVASMAILLLLLSVSFQAAVHQRKYIISSRTRIDKLADAKQQMQLEKRRRLAKGFLRFSKGEELELKLK